MNKISALVLAAGQGKRMYSTTPKVLHPILGVPMVGHVIGAIQKAEIERICLVVGVGKAELMAQTKTMGNFEFAVQENQLGTGDAVRAAASWLGQEAAGATLILCADTPLIQAETIRDCVDFFVKENAEALVVTAEVDDPYGYGRIIRSDDGEIISIREEKDCKDFEQDIDEINTGFYIFSNKVLLSALEKLQSNNAQGEYYLTDVIEIMSSQSNKIVSWCLSDPDEFLGVNDRAALVFAEKTMSLWNAEKWLGAGVTIRDTHTVSIDSKSTFGQDVEIESSVIIRNSKIGSNVSIQSGSRIENTTLADGVIIKQGSVIEDSDIGVGVSIGPYAHLRPGTVLHAGVKIGNFVELKKTTMGENSKASHLSYLGNATVGKNSNIGCGFITCNYDGAKKQHTTIGDDVFIGSDSQAVAPVKIESGSYVAAGTTITKDVPGGALAIARVKQDNKIGFVEKLKGIKNVK